MTSFSFLDRCNSLIMSCNTITPSENGVVATLPFSKTSFSEKKSLKFQSHEINRDLGEICLFHLYPI